MSNVNFIFLLDVSELNTISHIFTRCLTLFRMHHQFVEIVGFSRFVNITAQTTNNVLIIKQQESLNTSKPQIFIVVEPIVVVK